MANLLNCILTNPLDNVLVSVEKLSAGDSAEYLQNGEQQSLQVITDIPIYHKIALQDFAVGDKIIKYGQIIAETKAPIKTGEHVHLQNIKSIENNG